MSKKKKIGRSVLGGGAGVSLSARDEELIAALKEQQRLEEEERLRKEEEAKRAKGHVSAPIPQNQPAQDSDILGIRKPPKEEPEEE